MCTIIYDFRTLNKCQGRKCKLEGGGEKRRKITVEEIDVKKEKQETDVQ